MKNFRYIVMAVTAAVVLAFVSCKKDNEKPPINNMDEGEKWSVATILDSLEKVATFLFDEYEPASVDAYVIGDERTGNIYRTIYIRDEKGDCIAVYREKGTEDFQVHAGDYITLNLSGAVAGYYNGNPDENWYGLPQIQLPVAGVEPDPNVRIIIRQRNVDIIPTPATLKEVNEGKHLCDLVKLSDVQFSDPNQTYAESEKSSDRGIEDCSGYSAVVRTSNYATFASDSLPKGKGDLVCVVSLYQKSESDKTWQMLIRNTSDVSMDGPRCGQIGGQPQDMPYEQSFATSFGTYSTYDVSGEQSWGIDFSTAKMTGFVDQVNYANEDWLISSPVNVMNVSHAKLSMSYIARYFSNLNHDVTLQVSTDYVFESDPTTATWETLDVELTESTNWDDFMTTEVSLDKYIGQQIWVAVKYLSTDSKAGTIEVQSIDITEGELTPPALSIFSEPFSSGQGDFTIQNVFMAQGLSWVWKYKSPYGMVASAFANNTSYESESWLISPAIDMNGFSSAVLTFEHAANKLNGSPADYYSVWVSTDYADGLPETATWTQLTVPTYPAGTNWTFVASGDIDMSAYLGNNNVRIAFRYTSEDGNSGSWEIKNVLINE